MNQYNTFKDRPVAYFCAEYALFDYDPLYAGGLGILAGDYVNAIIKEKFPVVAIGLFYHKNDEHGTELSKERITPTELGLTLVKDKKNNVIKIPISIKGHIIHIQAWQWKKENLNLLLLDTQIEENSKEDWIICDSLYDDDRYIRLMQEAILGIGGMKILEKLNIHPSVYHLNEGHSAFMAFELIKIEMQENKKSFKEALLCTKKHIVFTNHTLVAAGQELFDIEVMKTVFSDYIREIGVDMNDLIELGIDKERNIFSMTNLALNLSSKVNAVSKKHASEAIKIWKGYNVDQITNGIDVERWDQFKYYSHKELKKKLIDFIKDKAGVSFTEDMLIIGWARRFVEYKRPLIILEDIERLKKLASIEKRKIGIVFSSPVNSTYNGENDFITKLEQLIKGELKGIVAFIPDYDMNIAKYMVSGCDIWLNTPIVGREACGTSGMKACLNCVLPLTTSDGWVDEIDISSCGWTVEDNENINKNLIDTIEYKVAPEFFDNQDRWKERMKSARKLILDNFNTDRMLKEYIQKIYIPSYKNRDN